MHIAGLYSAIHWLYPYPPLVCGLRRGRVKFVLDLVLGIKAIPLRCLTHDGILELVYGGYL